MLKKMPRSDFETLWGDRVRLLAGGQRGADQEFSFSEM